MTERAIVRNCEAQAAVAAEEVRKQNVHMVKEAGEPYGSGGGDVEALAKEVERETFKSCMLKYAV